MSEDYDDYPDGYVSKDQREAANRAKNHRLSKMAEEIEMITQMATQMAPLRFKILAEVYPSREFFQCDGSSAQIEIFNDFLDYGIFCLGKEGYELTEKGRVYVRAILKAAGAVPYPVWVIPEIEQ